jgi:hypothetical protein
MTKLHQNARQIKLNIDLHHISWKMTSQVNSGLCDWLITKIAVTSERNELGSDTSAHFIAF